MDIIELQKKLVRQVAKLRALESEIKATKKLIREITGRPIIYIPKRRSPDSLNTKLIKFLEENKGKVFTYQEIAFAFPEISTFIINVNLSTLYRQGEIAKPKRGHFMAVSK